MTSASDILQFVDAVAEQFKPRRIVLFGSYAYGTPNYDSDVDILVVSDGRQTAYAQTVKISLAVMAPFALDLMVHSPSEIGRRIAGGDCFLDEIMKKGLVLYDSSDCGVGEKGRRRLRHRLAAVQVTQPITV